MRLIYRAGDTDIHGKFEIHVHLYHCDTGQTLRQTSILTFLGLDAAMTPLSYYWNWAQGPFRPPYFQWI